jgi:hypothetical protein
LLQGGVKLLVLEGGVFIIHKKTLLSISLAAALSLVNITIIEEFALFASSKGLTGAVKSYTVNPELLRVL